jgi:hypothetical protein
MYKASCIKALQCIDITQKEVSIESIKRLFALFLAAGSADFKIDQLIFLCL